MADNVKWEVRPMSWQGLALLFFVCSFAIFLRSYHVGLPDRAYFDEIYYGPAAINYIEGKPDKNVVHPPLGKLQISVGILFTRACNSVLSREIFDKNEQWRCASVVCGSMMVLMTFLLAYRMSRGNRSVALLAAFLVATDFMAIAMSRICMLDMVNSIWILIGVYCCWRYLECCWNECSLQKWWAIACAVSLAIATACKWNGLFAMSACWGAMVIFRDSRWATGLRSEYENISQSCGSDGEEKSSYLKSKISFIKYTALCGARYVSHTLKTTWKLGLKLGLLFFAVTSVVYIASYTPLFMRMGIGAEAWKEIWRAHALMIGFRYDAKQFHHTYLSYFWQWPLVLRPIWFYYQSSENKTVVNGIVCFGSVLLWWPALIHMIESFMLGIERRNVARLFAIAMWFIQWILWSSSITGGFIYYMLPCVPFLAIVVSFVMEDWSSDGMGWMALIYICALTVFFLAYWPFLSAESTSYTHFDRMFPMFFRWR